MSYLSALSSASWKAFTDSGLKRFSPRFIRSTTHAPIFSTSIFLLQEGEEGGAHPSPAHKIMEVEKIGSCVVLHMKCGQNVMTPEFLQAFSEALDKAER